MSKDEGPTVEAVCQRMSALPAKAAAPLRDLVTRRLLPPNTASVLMDAAELSGEPQHLLGFAVAMLSLQNTGIPVIDAVRMAHSQGKRINMRWSAKRWKVEHDRLSRAETVSRLTASNEAYDLSEYEPHLPASWPGYLVRSSRRLGLEGMRQRHCVASYHNDLRNSRCAIAVVFVHRRRWTVELQKTGLKDAPLRITQIRGRRNESPGAEIREAIHRHLGIALKKAAGADVERPYLDNLRRVLPVLREHRAESVCMRFSFGTDGPDFDGGTVAPGYGPPPDVTVRCEITQDRVLEWYELAMPGMQDAPLGAALDEITLDYLAETELERQYFDEGGHGSLTIDVQSGRVDMDVRVYDAESRPAFFRETAIDTGEVLYEAVC